MGKLSDCVHNQGMVISYCLFSSHNSFLEFYKLSKGFYDPRTLENRAFYASILCCDIIFGILIYHLVLHVYVEQAIRSTEF